jgi:DMSO/TMAO reductase YedYZ molybdopterin-dependent catalytic subunit
MGQGVTRGNGSHRAAAPDLPLTGVPPQPGAPEQGGGTAAEPGAAGGAAAEPGAAGGRLPPGQHLARIWPVMHYGPVPKFRPERWDLRVFGATESGSEERWDWAALTALQRCRITADFHCVTKFTISGVTWEGIAATEILRLVPPAPDVTHVMAWADYGYSANLRIGDFADDRTLLATHRDGAELAPEHGFPLRLVVPCLYGWKSVKWLRAIEYMSADRRGFWEERGYHNRADPWHEQRYSYQECEADGPPL